MGGLYCLPTSADTPANAATHDPQGAAGAPLLLTQDGLGGDCHNDAADNNALTATAPFRLPPAAQGTKRRFSNATDHTVVDDALMGNVDNVDDALMGTVSNANKVLMSAADNVDDALTSTIDAAKLGTQATGASDNGTNDAPPSLTQGKTVDGGNKGEERGDPGPIAQGEEGTVRARDVKGEEDLGRQILHACNNQLVMVYRDSIHRNNGRHLDGGVTDDSIWQWRYNWVVAHPHPMYNPPKGGLGQRVVLTMAREFGGVREWRWNSERALIFACVSCERVRA
jgi:hypothetical protein